MLVVAGSTTDYELVGVSPTGLSYPFIFTEVLSTSNILWAIVAYEKAGDGFYQVAYSSDSKYVIAQLLVGKGVMIFDASKGDLVFSKLFNTNVVYIYSRTLIMEGSPNYYAYLATHDTVITIFKIDPFSTSC